MKKYRILSFDEISKLQKINFKKENSDIKFSSKEDEDKNSELKKKVSDETKVIIVAGATGAATGMVSDAIRGTTNLGAKSILKGGKKLVRLIRI